MVEPNETPEREKDPGAIAEAGMLGRWIRDREKITAAAGDEVRRRLRAVKKPRQLSGEHLYSYPQYPFEQLVLACQYN